MFKGYSILFLFLLVYRVDAYTLKLSRLELNIPKKWSQSFVKTYLSFYQKNKTFSIYELKEKVFFDEKKLKDNSTYKKLRTQYIKKTGGKIKSFAPYKTIHFSKNNGVIINGFEFYDVNGQLSSERSLFWNCSVSSPTYMVKVNVKDGEDIDKTLTEVTKILRRAKCKFL